MGKSQSTQNPKKMNLQNLSNAKPNTNKSYQKLKPNTNQKSSSKKSDSFYESSQYKSKIQQQKDLIVYPMSSSIIQQEYNDNSNDLRQKIDNSKFPFTAIGYILSKFPINRITGCGTGFLIHDNIVLTCAHNVYSKQQGRFAYDVQFSPGLNGQQGKSFLVCQFFVPKEFIQILDFQQYKRYDFAILVLYVKSIADDYGYLAINQEKIQKNQKIQVYGYPDDLNLLQDHTRRKRYLFGCAGKIHSVDNQKVYHLVNTSQGQSGSPILRRVNNRKNYEVIGIHTAKGNQYNHGIKLTQQVLRKINSWMKIIQTNKLNQQKHYTLPKEAINVQDIKSQRMTEHKYVQGQKQAINVIYEKQYYQENNPNLLMVQCQKYFQLGNYSKSVKFNEKAWKILKETHIQIDLYSIYVLNKMGLNYATKGQLDFALQCYFKGVQLQNKLGSKNYEIQAQLLKNIGTVHKIKYNYEEAMKFYKQALQVIKKNQEQKDRNIVAQIFRQIAQIRYHDKQSMSLQEALCFCNKGIQILEKNQSLKTLDYADILHTKGKIYEGQGQSLQALKYYQKSLEIKKQIYGPTHISLADTINNIGNFSSNYIKNKKSAKQYYLLALSIYQKSLGSHHIKCRIPLFNLIYLQACQGNFQQAQKSINEYAKYFSSLLQLRQSKQIKIFFCIVDQLLQKQRRQKHSQTRQYLNKVYQLLKKISKTQDSIDNDKCLFLYYKRMGITYYYQGNHKQAMKNYKKVIDIFEKTKIKNEQIYDFQYENYGQTLINIGLVNLQWRNYMLADDNFHMALDVFYQKLKRLMKNNLNRITLPGDYLLSQNRNIQALASLQKALKKLQKILPQDDIYFSDIFKKIGVCYYQQNNNQKALQFYEKSAQSFNKSYQKLLQTDSTQEFQEKTKNNNIQRIENLAQTYLNIGLVHFIKKQYQNALGDFHKSLQIYQKIHKQFSCQIARPYFNIGRIHYIQKNYIKSIDFLQKSSEIYQKYQNCLKNSQQYLAGLQFLAILYKQINQFQKSLSYFQKYFELFKLIQGTLSINAKNLLVLKEVMFVYKKINQTNQAFEDFLNIFLHFFAQQGKNDQIMFIITIFKVIFEEESNVNQKQQNLQIEKKQIKKIQNEQQQEEKTIQIKQINQ